MKKHENTISMVLGAIVIIVLGTLVLRYFRQTHRTMAKDPTQIKRDQASYYLFDVCVNHTCYPQVERYEADPYCIRIWRGDYIDFDCGDINIELRHRDSTDTDCRCDF